MSQRGGGGYGPVLLLAGAAYVAAGFAGKVPFPNFEGGESDPAPTGVVVYQGQEAHSVSDRLLIDIGDGTAQVAVQARQKWDTPGGVFSGDFVSDNGTSFVRNSEHSNQPAVLPVDMDYCSEGYVEVDGREGNIKSVTYHMGALGVCGAHLDFGKSEVSSSFHQDDTPDDFNGNFVSFITNGVEETALAAPCPTEELQKYQSGDVVAHFQKILSDRFGVGIDAVTIDTGEITATSQVDQMSLKANLNSFANMQDPKDPGKTYKALDIQFITANAAAVETSCYMSSGGTKFEDLQSADINLSATDG